MTRQQHEIAALTSQSDVLRMQLAALARAKATHTRRRRRLVPAPNAPRRPIAVIAPKPLANRRMANDDGDVIRRALEAIEANEPERRRRLDACPSHGAVPFGH